MDNQNIIESTRQFVKQELAQAESGHDWFHIERVYKLSLTIAKEELNKGKQLDIQIVELGALLHDIADHKFHGGDETVGPKKARKFLEQLSVDEKIVTQVEDIIKHISFKGAQVENTMSSLEGQIVQDADRIDAMGAIGIARCFTYGGYKNRILYDPNIKPQLHSSFEEYKNSQSTTLNHFYEKLLLLKDKMNTDSGREIALYRHKIMEDFVDQFKIEWEGLA